MSEGVSQDTPSKQICKNSKQKKTEKKQDCGKIIGNKEDKPQLAHVLPLVNILDKSVETVYK